ncbi:hypothetical protein [Acinetobacter gerneri]|jgi:hypothetical protein|uniref:hypothetical protein n=1 Tax=Acinetobacter gerneri TaxID=202952 RepID=UPI0023F30D95|nr:hypothetical protein [Acinetobacter gerneri]MCH4245295.1 hypothetical protein [Acinetobacter gerneri]
MENQNDLFQDLAAELALNDSNPTFNREFLDPQKLDYSLESLNYICEFLIDSDKKELNLQPYTDLVRLTFRVGAYVGETIRKNDKNKEWAWFEYDEAIKHYPSIDQYYEKSLGTQFLMVGMNKTKAQFSFPFNKVLKNLENGEEDSVYAFAITQLLLQELPDEIQNVDLDLNILK